MPQYKLHNPYGDTLDPETTVMRIMEDYGLANVRQVLQSMPTGYRDDVDRTVTVGEIHLPHFEYIDVNLHTIKYATDGSHILIETVDVTDCDACNRDTDRDALMVSEETGNAYCPSCYVNLIGPQGE